MMKYPLLYGLFAVVLVTGCQNTPEIQTGENAEIIQGNLHRVNHSLSQRAYIDPMADFTKYNAILLTPLGVDNVEIVQPSSAPRSTRSRNWELTATDKQRLQKDYRDAMVKRLSQNGGYLLVETIGDKVLQISTILTRLAPNAPKDDARSRPLGRSTIITEGAGKIDIEVAFKDSETGELLALTKDSKSGSALWSINNTVSNAAEVRRAFDRWAMQIRGQLDRLHNKTHNEKKPALQ